MSCQNCNSNRLINISAKCSDLCLIEIGDTEYDGYVPRDIGIGGGDYVRMTYCLECGQIHGDWPMPLTQLEGEQDGEQDGDQDAEL